VSRDRGKGSRRWSAPAVLVVLAIVVALLGAGVWVAAGKGLRLPRFSFPADHGVSTTDPDWLRCAAETIQRHPQEFGAQHGFGVELRQRQWVVSGTWFDKWIEVADGKIADRSPGSTDARKMPLDCPGVGFSAPVESPSPEPGGAAS
jgi:hypothetical protein